MEQNFKKLSADESNKISGGVKLVAGKYYYSYSYKNLTSGFTSGKIEGPYDSVKAMEKAIDDLQWSLISSGNACQVKCTYCTCESDGSLVYGKTITYPGKTWSD